MTVRIQFSNGDKEIAVPDTCVTGFEILKYVIDNREESVEDTNKHTLNYAIIDGITFGAETYICDFKAVEFNNCVFDNARFQYSKFYGCKGKGNTFHYEEDADISWIARAGLKGKTVTKKAPPILTPTNEQIAERYGVTVTALPNKSFVKIKWTCAFCHRDFTAIARRDRVEKVLTNRKDVPNCAKKVCEQCFNTYRLSEKFYGHRHYGYSGAVAKHTTDMDAKNTVLIGLEMEFEGDFTGWKELEDAHKGQLHYGYDSSVIGQNELSWDCGSYSWWKYLAPLKNVCDVLKKFGGAEGDTAGIHIHVSRPDINVESVTQTLNTYCCGGVFNILMRAVPLRNNLERFNMYANLGANASHHHAAISYNSHGTCEFRVFNSSLDNKLILRHMKFCKELFNQVAEGTPKDSILRAFSKETKKHILDCAETQAQKGFITLEERDELLGILK